MIKVKVFVTLRESILDPAGNAVKNSLHKLKFQEVSGVRIGKYIELELDNTDGVTTTNTSSSIEGRVKEMCEKLLANTVIEDYRFELEA